MDRDELEHAIETAFEQYVAMLFSSLCLGNATEASNREAVSGGALKRFEAGFRIAVAARDQAMATIDRVLSANRQKAKAD